MQRLGIVAVLDELVGYLLRLQLRAAEDDGKDTRIVVNDTLQGQILVLGVHHIVNMVHVLGALVAAAHHDLLRVVQVALGYALYLAAHRSREEQRVAVVGYALQNGVDALREAHVEHFVSLVEHHVVGLVKMGYATVHQVYQSARRGHDDVRHASGP